MFYNMRNTYVLTHVTTKIRRGVVMILTKLYTVLHCTCDLKNEVWCSYDFV